VDGVYQLCWRDDCGKPADAAKLLKEQDCLKNSLNGPYNASLEEDLESPKMKLNTAVIWT
jgi:hypothetical protein